MRLDLTAIELIGGVLLAPSCGRAVIDGARLTVDDGSPDGGPAGEILHLGAADEQVLLAAVEVAPPDLDPVQGVPAVLPVPGLDQCPHPVQGGGPVQGQRAVLAGGKALERQVHAPPEGGVHQGRPGEVVSPDIVADPEFEQTIAAALALYSFTTTP